MALGKTLAETLTQMQVECGISLLPSLGQDARETMKGHIRTVYEEELVYEWQHLTAQAANAWWDKLTSAGQRYYDWPAGMDPLTIREVWWLFGDQYIQLSKGISVQDYNAFNSDNGVRSDPAQKWDWHGKAQFELWPIPPVNNVIIRFNASKLLPDLTSESAVLDLDHIMLAQRAAGKFMRKRDPKMALQLEADGVKRRRLLLHSQNKNTTLDLSNRRVKTDPLDPRGRIRVVTPV